MKNSFLLIAVLFTLSATAQTSQANHNIDSLICKSWNLTFYEESGEKFQPGPEQKNDRMIFYFDHKVKSIETDNIQNGVWDYDPIRKLLTVIDNDTKEKAIMKVLKLTNDECILEYKDPEGTLLIMNMVPASK